MVEGHHEKEAFLQITNTSLWQYLACSGTDLAQDGASCMGWGEGMVPVEEGNYNDHNVLQVLAHVVVRHGTARVPTLPSHL